MSTIKNNVLLKTSLDNFELNPWCLCIESDTVMKMLYFLHRSFIFFLQMFLENFFLQCDFYYLFFVFIVILLF